MLAWINTALNYLEPAMVFPVITVLLLLVFFLYYKNVSQSSANSLEWVERVVNPPRLTFVKTRHPMEIKDIAPLAVITLVFSFLAFFQLGDTEAPQSFFQFTEEQRRVRIELDYPEEISSLKYYTGLWTGHYTLEFSEDGIRWLEQYIPQDEQETDKSPSHAMNQSYSHLFKWRNAELNNDNPPVKYIRLTASNTPMELGEVALYGSGGGIIPIARISCPDAPALFDEQELVPRMPTYMNSMYFDEIYHGRTALEHLRGIFPYETTHPPLGKEIIAVSVSAFGMTPFGWRFAGALFGVVMLIVLYIFIKNLFGKTAVAICGTLLLGFDFMRFVQTRIATIDTYGVFFILVSYYFMYRFLSNDMNLPFRKSMAPLALSGVFFGIGCASKWIVVYSGAGLLALFVIRLVMLSRHYDKNARLGFEAFLIKTFAWSALFFIFFPVVIYCLSYIPYGIGRGMSLGNGLLTDRKFYETIWDNQKLMLSYHGKLVSEHPYASRWYQWIIDARPILYYNSYDGDMRSSFAAFGNPAVWWGGLVAMVAMGIYTVKRRDGKALFIVIGYLSQLLPWIAISRIVFVYHYFPSTLFLVLALAYMFNTILESGRNWRRLAVYGYTSLTGALFGMFYPALTGVSAPQAYFKYFLRWIPRVWPF
ncbi:MAG: glycosyltransferase family 39 protein [Oscillospiraceae bacterium]|nr:glycosyltransferase family 39 protein [Oscillospiraceae bacterium]